MALSPLSLIETRVLGVLVEKEKTVPDTYPLSLNALVAGCNQKNSRNPILNTTEAEVQRALDGLRHASWVIESSGARVTRFSHNVGRVLRVPDQAVALLSALMLRGPQTSGELRGSTERLHAFADISAVEAFLDELAQRSEDKGGPLVVKLGRAAGEREARWAHLLSGPVATVPDAAPSAPAEDTTALTERLERLEAQVAALVAELAALRGRPPGG